jgi:nitrous oxidase accessory protein NosD
MPTPPSPKPKRTVHVWQECKTPRYPYADKDTAAQKIAEGLTVAADYRDKFPADEVNVTVHGDGPNGTSCIYTEHVMIPRGGIELAGEKMPVIDGQSTGPAVRFKEDEAAVSFLSGFEIINGRAPGSGGASGKDGAGVYASNASVVVSMNCIHLNRADGHGGGVYIGYTDEKYYSRKSYVVSNQIYLNSAQYGGAIGIKGNTFPWLGKPSDPVVFVASNKVVSNAANQGTTYRYGGGISVYELPAEISDNEISFNQAPKGWGEAFGGGVCVFNEDFSSPSGLPDAFATLVNPFGSYNGPQSLAPRQVSLKSNNIHDNEAHKGGGVAGFWFAVLSLTSNRLAGNRSETNGGGLYATGGSVANFQSGNFFYSNKAQGNIGAFGEDGCGGGVHASCRSSLNFFGPDNKFLGNHAYTLGGGISIRHSDLWADPESLFVQNNQAAGRSGPGSCMGGGICSVIRGTIYRPCVWNNSVHLYGVLVEGNQAANGGSGIYIEKDLSLVIFNSGTGRVDLNACIIRGNAGGGAGLEIRRVDEPSPSLKVRVSSCLVENHDAGIAIEDVVGDTDLVGNVIRNNNTGVAFRQGGGRFRWRRRGFNRYRNLWRGFRFGGLDPGKQHCRAQARREIAHGCGKCSPKLVGRHSRTIGRGPEWDLSQHRP